MIDYLELFGQVVGFVFLSSFMVATVLYCIAAWKNDDGRED